MHLMRACFMMQRASMLLPLLSAMHEPLHAWHLLALQSQAARAHWQGRGQNVRAHSARKPTVVERAKPAHVQAQQREKVKACQKQPHSDNVLVHSSADTLACPHCTLCSFLAAPVRRAARRPSQPSSNKPGVTPAPASPLVNTQYHPRSGLAAPQLARCSPSQSARSTAARSGRPCWPRWQHQTPRQQTGV